LALAGPVLAERQALFDFIVAELRHREHLDPPRIRPVRTALEKQRDDLLAFAGVLDERLAGIAQDCDAPLYLVRDVCLLQRKSPSSNAYWQRWNLLHKKLAGKFQRVADAVTQAMKHIPRASSLVESLNSRRATIFPPPSIGHTLSQPVAVLPQSPHLPSQPPSRTSRQKPKRIDDRTSHPHWLELLGFTRFSSLELNAEAVAYPSRFLHLCVQTALTGQQESYCLCYPKQASFEPCPNMLPFPSC